MQNDTPITTASNTEEKPHVFVTTAALFVLCLPAEIIAVFAVLHIINS